MQKDYTQLLLGLLIGLLAGLLLGKFVFTSPSTIVEKGKTENIKVNNKESSAAEFSNEQLPKKSESNSSNNSNIGQDYSQSVSDEVPQKAFETLAYIKANGKAPEGYVGGRVFQNREKQLPMTNSSGEKINYQEWDVNPKVQGKNRGTQRLVIGDDGRSWYTGDHYRSFTLIKQ